MATTALVLLLLLGAAPPLEAAKRHLAAGKLDEVLFELDGKTFPEAERAGAAGVLAEAARASLEAKDLVLALQFAQMALRIDKQQPLALETGARASLQQKQFDPAEDYSDRLIAQAPRAPLPRLLRAEIALEEGEWAKVISLTREVDPQALSRADKARLLSLLQTAARELSEREAAKADLVALQRQLEAQAAQVQQAVVSVRAAPASVELPKVVVYTTAWCGYCKRAKAWLAERKIPFVEKDIEKEPDAQKELDASKRAAGISQGGVPVIDVGGQLILGFDVPALERRFPQP